MRIVPVRQPCRVGLPLLAGLALLIVVLRLVLFDYATFFTLEYIPNHDMYQGASLFATSMHSIRLSGDIAWWNPVSVNGYAQYYQSLLSPLAPTLGHIVFIVSAQIVLALSFLGVSVPEYFQYLTVTYVVLPFLATLAFAWICSLLVRSLSAVTLGTVAFTFSAIGLWNSAWFYFQESASLLFLLGAAIAFLQRPGPRSVALALAAALVQLASLNYWTLFNSWFVLIFLGAYIIVHPLRVRRACRRLVDMVWHWPACSASFAAGALAVACLWIGIIASAVLNEATLYRRAGRPEGYLVADALAFVNPGFYLGRIFHPDIESVAPRPYNTFWTMHHAVYLGAFLVPLLLALSFHRWRRLERWLLLSVAGVLAVCFAAPPLVWAWEQLPWMNRIRHLFMFYPTFARLLLVLLSCVSLDRLLSGRSVVSVRVSLGTLTLGVAAILLLGGRTFGPLARLGGLPASVLVLLPAAFVGWALIRPTPRHRALLVGVFLLVALGDLSTYFRHVSRLDSDFTATRWPVQRPLPPEVTRALRRPWAPFDPDSADSLFLNMPIPNDLWPVNNYMPHRYVAEFLRQSRRQWDNRFVAFHPDGAPASMPGRTQDLLIELPHEWRYRDYNRWSLVVHVPQAGWLSVAQLHDPSWRAEVDGRRVETHRANDVRTAIPVTRGRHEVQMVYRPLPRRLYWLASAALELALLLLGLLAWKAGPGRPPKGRFLGPTPPSSP